MNILNAVAITLWLILAVKCIVTKIKVRHHGVTQKEIIAVSVFVLAGLNISIGLINIGNPHPIGSSTTLSEYLSIGASLFQLLISKFILTYIRKTKG